MMTFIISVAGFCAFMTGVNVAFGVYGLATGVDPINPAISFGVATFSALVSLGVWPRL